MEENSISLECVSRKDKFHFLRVPKGFDIAQLDGVTFDPKQTIEFGAKPDKNGVVKMFELGAVRCQSMDWSLLVKSEHGIKLGPGLNHYFNVTKNIRVDTSTDTKEASASVVGLKPTSNGIVSFPSGLRERFIPFGYNCPTSPKQKHDSKNKKKRKDPSDASPSPVKQQESHCQEDDNDDYRAHKKKRKRSRGDETSYVEGDSSLNPASEESIVEEKSHHSKKKKRKKDKD